MKHSRRNQLHSILWWNSLSVLLVLALIFYGKFFGLSPKLLVEPPPGSQNLYIGFLTHTMQMLCAVPAIACAFSVGLLRTFQSERQRSGFLLSSALVTGGFWVNEIFRIHIILRGTAGIPKWLTILGYSSILLVYGWVFRRRWQSTPYGLILISGCMFFLAFAMDSHLLGKNVSDLLEGVPKFLSFLNLALYFWLVCRQEVLEEIKVMVLKRSVMS